MCGFAGFVDRNHRLVDPAATLRDMVRTIAHRGPDGEGYFQDARFGLGMTVRGAEIGEGSSGAQAPLKSPAGRWIIACDGELWNHREMRARLHAEGVSFAADGGTRVVAAALDAYGVHATLLAIDGVFAWAALDLHERALWLARDRLGVKPCFWGHAEGGAGPGVFVFGTEMRALRRCPAFLNRVDPFAIAGVLGGLCVPGHRAMFQGVHKLRPGCAVRLDLLTGRVDELRWFDVRTAARDARVTPFTGTKAEGVRVLGDLIDAAVQRRLPSEDAVGVSLSGGVSDSLVLTAMKRSAARSIKAITVGFQNGRPDERPRAQEVAEWLGVESVETTVDERELPLLAEDVIASFDEPFADPQAFMALVSARLARQEVGTMFTGDGGNEFFAGHDRHVRGFAVARVLKVLPVGVRRLMASGAEAIARTHRGRALQEAALLLRTVDAEQLWQGFFAAWKNPAELLQRLPGDAWRAAVTRERRSMQHPFAAEQPEFLDEMLLRDQTSYLPDDVLITLDRCSLECGLEARAPLLDQRIFEFAWQMPPAWRIHASRGMHVLREVLKNRLPQGAAPRAGSRMAVPLQAWLAGPLRAWTADVLDRGRLNRQGVLHIDPIMQSWNQCQQGDESAALRVWTACIVSRWCEREGVDGSRIGRT